MVEKVQRSLERLILPSRTNCHSLAGGMIIQVKRHPEAEFPVEISLTDITGYRTIPGIVGENKEKPRDRPLPETDSLPAA